jgi:membrane protein DedA with SNARE-associated domain
MEVALQLSAVILSAFGDLIQHYGYMAVLIVVGLESLGIPLPGETMLISASLYAGATHNLHIAFVIAAAATGAILGDNAGYLLGHWGGYRLLVRFGRYIRLDEAKVKVARYLFLRQGGKVVFFGRFVSILRTYAAFLAGTARMPWRSFLVFNAAGGVVWATVYGVAAYSLGSQVERLSRPIAIAFAVIGIAATVAVALVIRSHEKRLEAVAELAFPGQLEGYPGGKPV